MAKVQVLIFIYSVNNANESINRSRRIVYLHFGGQECNVEYAKTGESQSQCVVNCRLVMFFEEKRTVGWNLSNFFSFVSSSPMMKSWPWIESAAGSKMSGPMFLGPSLREMMVAAYLLRGISFSMLYYCGYNTLRLALSERIKYP